MYVDMQKSSKRLQQTLRVLLKYVFYILFTSILLDLICYINTNLYMESFGGRNHLIYPVVEERIILK
jgi:hypothetical protein